MNRNVPKIENFLQDAENAAECFAINLVTYVYGKNDTNGWYFTCNTTNVDLPLKREKETVLLKPSTTNLNMLKALL